MTTNLEVAEYAVTWRSSDGGLSWSPRTPRHDIRGREFSANVLSDGTVLMPNAVLPEDAFFNGTYTQLFRSTDHGNTFSVQSLGPNGFDYDWSVLEFGGAIWLPVSRKGGG